MPTEPVPVAYDDETEEPFLAWLVGLRDPLADGGSQIGSRAAPPASNSGSSVLDRRLDEIPVTLPRLFPELEWPAREPRRAPPPHVVEPPVSPQESRGLERPPRREPLGTRSMQDIPGMRHRRHLGAPWRRRARDRATCRGALSNFATFEVDYEALRDNLRSADPERRHL